MKASMRTLCGGLTTLLIGITSAAYGFPDFDSDCASCHSRPDGAFDVLPSDLVEAALGGTTDITFDVTDVAAGVEASIRVAGLDAADLMASPDLTNWNEQTDGTDNWLTSDLFNSVGSVVLSLSIGNGATPGDYPLNAVLAGGAGADGGRWSTMRDFVVRVVVPEPKPLILLSAAFMSGGAFLRRRWLDNKNFRN